MPANLSEWDARYLAGHETAPDEPASIIRELLPLLPLGPALDLACGTGRHTLLHAARPQPVTAIDGSKEALGILERRARAAHLPVSFENGTGIRAETRTRHIRLVHADLEQATLPQASFALIVCVHYLQNCTERSPHWKRSFTGSCGPGRELRHCWRRGPDESW